MYMDHRFKHGIVILIWLCFFFGIFIVVERIRIENDIHAKPYIILKEENYDNSIVYHSIGYKLVNKYSDLEVTHGVNRMCIGQEMWLFNYFMIWGWIS